MLHLDPSDVRPSPLAGRWYPARPDSLRATIETFLQDAAVSDAESTSPGSLGKLVGLLAPHAGYRFSGPVAAYAFHAARDQAFDTAVVIGPLHYNLPGLSRSDRALTTGHAAYETPLGVVPVDQETLAALTAKLPLTPVRNDPEHSVEIELPFLQHILPPGFSLVPIMLRDQSEAMARKLGTALAEVLAGKHALLVASSDLSHFYPQNVAQQLDAKMLACVEAMDAAHVIEYDETGVAFACGHGAIASVIYALQAAGNVRAKIVHYATSGDANGDLAQVVGYGAATFRQN